MDTYANDRWPTRDKVIPFQLFRNMNEEMERHLMPLEEFMTAQGTATGQAFVQAGKDGKIKAYNRKLRKSAFPEETLS